MPPELVERARIQAECDAVSAAPGKSRRARAKQKPVRYAEPPRGRHRGRSLAAAVLGALLLAVSSLWLALGTQAPANRGPLWLALWGAGQAATLCVFLLCLFPLRKAPRRLALIASLGAGLLFGMAASVAAELRRESDMSPAVQVTAMVIATLLALAFAPSLWLLLGALRRKTTEKFAALTAGVSFAVGLLSLLTTLAGGKAATADPPVCISALELVQSLCFLYLIGSWPVLECPVTELKP